MKVLKITLNSFLLILLFGCSSGADKQFSHDELLKDRVMNKSTHIPKIALDTDPVRSFNAGSLRLENPEFVFTYFPEVMRGAVSSPKKVRFSMYESVQYKKGY